MTSTEIKTGTASFHMSKEIGWTIDVEGAKRSLAHRPDHRLRLCKDESGALRFPVRPLTLGFESGESIKVGGMTSEPEAIFTVSDMGVISAELRFDLKGMSMPDVVKFSHALDEDQSGDLREFGACLISKLTKQLQGQIIEPTLKEAFETYRIYFLNELLDQSPAVELVNSHRSQLAQILKGEIKTLGTEQIEDALRVAISYFNDDRVIIDTRNAVLLGNASFRDVSTVLGFTVIELLELKVMEDFLKKLLETDNNKTSKIGNFSLRHLQAVQQDIAIQRGRVINPLDLNDDQYFADIRRLTAQRLGLQEWAEELNAKLKVVKDISDSLISRKNHRWAMALEATIVALVGYEVLQMIVEKHL